MKKSFIILSAIASVLGSTMAFADCLDGVRDATPAERAFFQKVYMVLKEVFPAAPGGWTVSQLPYSGLGGMCKGTPEGGFSVTVTAKYTYRFPKEEAERMNAEQGKIQSEIDAVTKLPPELTKERNELMAKYSEKTRAARKADQEGNKELARSLYAERDAFGRQANEVRDRHLASVKPKTDELSKRMQALSYGPQDVLVRVSANGGPGTLGREESEIVVGTVPAPRSHGLKVHGVRMVLNGPTPKREEIMSLVDRARLERVLQ